MKRFSEKEINLIKLHYPTKNGVKILSELLPDRTKGSIKHKSLELSVGKYNNWNESELEILRNSYSTEQDKNKILEQIPNRTWCSIQRKASELKINRDFSYTKNELFFEIPNLINCWVAGYISGDANLCEYENNKYKRLSFGLKSEDIDILYEIKKLTNFNGNIRTVKRKFEIKNYRKSANIKPYYKGEGFYSYMEINGAEKWHEDLKANWNIIPNKVKRLLPPNLIDLKLVLSFLGGNINADGNISYDYNEKSNRKGLNITFLGTKQFLTWIKQQLDNIVPNIANSKVDVERPGSEMNYHKICGVKAYIISKMILSLDIFHLERKWETSRKYIKMVENYDISKRFLNLLRDSLTPEVISFVKGTNQEFPEDFLIKIGYLDKKDKIIENSNSQSPIPSVNT